MDLITGVFVVLSSMLEHSLFFMLLAAFIWGVLSIVLSPCHISSIPLVVGYVNRNGLQSRGGALLTSLYFSGGVLVSLLIVGVATSLMGQMIGDIGQMGMMVVGAVFVLTGLWLIGLVRLPSHAFPKWRNTSALGGILMGFIFGAALGPCTFGFMFPVLAVVFRAADQNLPEAIAIAMSYAVGHSLVIVLAGVGVNQLQTFLNWDAQARGTLWLKRLCGVLIILTGFYLAWSR